MMEIVALGSLRDPHVERVVSRLRRREMRCEIIDPSETLVSIEQRRGELAVTINGDALPGDCVIWDRAKFFVGSPFHGGLNGHDAFRLDREGDEFRFMEWRAVVGLLGDLFPLRVVNNPLTSRRMNKVYQQVVANSVGLMTPATIVTNEKSVVLRFQEQYGEIVNKSFSGGRMLPNADGQFRSMMTTPVTSSDLSETDAAELACCPHMFQERIRKAYELRIFVVEDRSFPFRINSQDHAYTRTDWRFGQKVLNFEPTAIPDSLRVKIREFMRCFDLFSGSFDFAADIEGNYWFLECNQAGAWGWLDDVVQGSIADAIAEALCETSLRTKANPPRLIPGATLETLNRSNLMRAVAASTMPAISS